MSQFGLTAHGNLIVDSYPVLTKGLQGNCPATAISCQDQEDACCVPDMGKMTLALQWILFKDIKRFTIHGFWPGDCTTGMTPKVGCGVGATDAQRDLDLYPELKANMSMHWVSGHEINERMWDHQWKKHGTCLSSVRDICPLGREEGPPRIRYFKASMRESEQFNVYEELKSIGVVPRLEPYALEDIKNALINWDNTYRLQCVQGRLYQIFFYRLGKAGNQFIRRPYHGSHACPSEISYFPKNKKLDKYNKLISYSFPTALESNNVND